MAEHAGVIMFIIAVATLLIFWLFSWLTKTSYPVIMCVLCGKHFTGPDAYNKAMECEDNHIHGSDEDQ